MGALKRVSELVSSGLEKQFYKLGLFVGSRPFTILAISSTICALSLLGLLRFRREARIEKLWAEPGTRLFDDKRYIEEHFPDEFQIAFQLGVREPRNLASGELDAGILEASVIHQLYKIHKGIVAINASDKEKTYSWDQYAYPRRGNNAWITSILALWDFDGETILNLTTPEILAKMNEDPLMDPWNGGLFRMSSVVARIQRDDGGSIVRASATRSVYRFYINKTFDSSEGREVDPRGKDFSAQFGKWIDKKWDQFDIMVPFSWAEFDKASEELINGDIILITLGYTLIFTYVSFNLGRFNRLHGRAWLAGAGIVSTGMAIGMAFGLCSALGFFYGPVHSALPFLLIGIGVDDMFVIVQAWDSLPEEVQKAPIPERLARTMSLAGTSVTVTSITDFVAFCVGASTILPALQSFCVYAGFGVFFDLCFQVTFFAATLALDARRVDAKRDSCLPCLIVKEKDYWPGHPLPERVLQGFFEKYYSVYLFKPLAKAFVIVTTLALFGAGIHSVVQLEIHFDYFWFLPADSSLTTYIRQQDKYFGATLPVDVYTGNVNYSSPVVQDKLNELANQTANSPYTKRLSVDPWIWGFQTWAKSNRKITTGEDFYPSLMTFLETPHGRHHVGNLRFQRITNEDGEENVTLFASRFRVDTVGLNHTKEQVKAMDDIRGIATSIIYPNGHSNFAYHWAFLPWSTNKVIDEELLRNVLLAMAAVFIVTLVLIADVFSALLVLICVTLSLADICLVIYHWDLTINTVTTVMIVMSIGLSVDYSAHVAHMFMVHKGTRQERAQAALNGIGVSVFNGGISTFLAFVLLAASKSYVFKVFFRIFLASVLFGLFHGLAFLPVILSFIGAPSHTKVLSREGSKYPITAKVSETELGAGADVTKNSAVEMELKDADSQKTSEGKGPFSNGSVHAW